jgi:dTDP-4-amino-4,6-dideoxygalactose transaminase
MSSPLQVPFHRPSIGPEEIEEVADTLRSGWLTAGPKTARFEQEFKSYVNAAHALAVNSCTAGLHLALSALNIGPGQEVITTPLTFCATVNVILHVGATPVLADVRPDGNIDPARIAERITPRTRAVIPVHLAGLPCDMDAIRELARRHELCVVEDAAHAAGAFYKGTPIGSSCPGENVSDAVVFSFHPTKNLTTGEGGMVTTPSGPLADTMKLLCLHGISKNAWNRYSDRGSWHYDVLLSGFKYNFTDIQAAIGIHQLRKLEHFLEVRRRYAALYREILADVEEIELPPDTVQGRHAWHLYILRLNLGKLEIGRGEFIDAMKARGVGASVHFIPIPHHPFFLPYAREPRNRCPCAEALYPRLISAPLYPGMTEGQVEYAAQCVKEIARQARKCKPVAAGAGLG